MFGQNKVTTRHAFDDQQHNHLTVTSIFPTLQGEGYFAGRAAVFVRLTGCNLKCSFCDTYFDKGDDMSFEDIQEKIRIAALSIRGEKRADSPILVVLTGGEPFLQPNFAMFLYYLTSHGFATQVESNGNFFQQIPGSTHLVVSPKINETTHQFIKLSEKCMDRADTLKFVISATEPGYSDVPDWAITWVNDKRGRMRTRRIYVSPMNCYLEPPVVAFDDGSIEDRNAKERISFWTPDLLDHVANQRNHELAAEVAMRRNVLLTLQMHLYASLP